jgi:hypothetical protein
MAIKALQDELDGIELSPGDVIIDMANGILGFLITRIRRVDIIEDDIYFWEVIWTNKPSEGTPFSGSADISASNILEEENLKLSIILGIIKWQSINGGTFDL